MLDIIRRPEAKRDLMDAADYIAQQNGFNASDRFLAATETAFRQLANMPGLGAIRDYGAHLPGLRVWRVPTFTKYLIFYHATDTDLEIIRVMHGAQNVERILNPPG